MKRKNPFISLLLLITVSPISFADTLKDAIENTLNTHPEISAASNSRHSAERNVRAAQGGYLPSISLNAGIGKENLDTPSTRAQNSNNDILTRRETSINLSQRVFDGFETSNTVAQQKATVNSRAYKTLNTSEARALDAVQAYLDVLQRHEFLRLAEENLSTNQRIYDQIKLRSEQGVGRLADLEQAEARVAQARNNVLTEQTNLTDAESNYFSVVGKEPVGLQLPSSDLLNVPATLVDAKRVMVANSPILKSAESDIEATRKQYEAQKSGFYPKFNVELARTLDENVDGTRGKYNEWQAMLRMRYNLYEGGSTKATLESKAFQVKEAEDVRNNTLRQLNEELRLSWSAMNNARQQLPIAQEYAERSRRVRDAYQKQFSLGERTLLDVLDSENERFTAQRRMVEIRFLSLYSQYRLKARMGDLLNSLSIPAPTAGQSLSAVNTQVDLPDLQ
ncbi:channel protein TolC [Lonsdalea britannica]|uniref:Channel protein TolC n=1 Tax=Lonsdalea britannica TaxID=1082704 RepID=A0AAD0SBY3_9GAMM|nr:TolC family outer membrane protein [Lonsdalea britannica]AXW85542.1 channel protein TolC [Lonsdalea britannica]OSM94012.1 channel protein TolC [Lonsdalea britannica]